MYVGSLVFEHELNELNEFIRNYERKQHFLRCRVVTIDIRQLWRCIINVWRTELFTIHGAVCKQIHARGRVTNKAQRNRSATLRTACRCRPNSRHRSMADVEISIGRNQSIIIMDKVKVFSKWHFIDALLLACVILLCLTFALHIYRGQWMDAVADAIWITIAIINVHRSARDTAMSAGVYRHYPRHVQLCPSEESDGRR